MKVSTIDGVVDVASTLTTDNWDCLNFFTSFAIVPSVSIEFVNLQYQTRKIKKSENSPIPNKWIILKCPYVWRTWSWVQVPGFFRIYHNAGEDGSSTD